MTTHMAPAWQTTAWLNSPKPLELADLRGKVVLLHAFQMLCPGCVASAIPQAKRAAQVFAGVPLAVVGLHTVFEHHAVMGKDALQAFLYEYRIEFPVGIDAPGPDGDPIPRTMRAYQMQGTPTTVLIDAEGRLRRQVFGTVDDLQLGADIGMLLAEAAHMDKGFTTVGASAATAGACGPAGCAI